MYLVFCKVFSEMLAQQSYYEIRIEIKFMYECMYDPLILK